VTAGAGAGGATGAGASASVGAKASYAHSDDTSQSNTSTARVSTITVGGNTALTSAGKTSLEGTAIKGAGDVSLTASSVDITAARDTQSSSSSSTSGSATLKVGIDAAKAARLEANGTLSAAQSERSASQALAGTIDASGNLTVRTTQGDANFEGTRLTAGGNASIDSAGSVNMTAARDASYSRSDSQNASLSISTEKSARGGVDAAADLSHEMERSSTARAGSVTAGGALTINARNDVTLEGTTTTGANGIALAAGGNVTRKAAENAYESEGFSAGLSASAERSNKGGEGGPPPTRPRSDAVSQSPAPASQSLARDSSVIPAGSTGAPANAAPIRPASALTPTHQPGAAAPLGGNATPINRVAPAGTLATNPAPAGAGPDRGGTPAAALGGIERGAGTSPLAQLHPTGESITSGTTAPAIRNLGPYAASANRAGNVALTGITSGQPAGLPAKADTGATADASTARLGLPTNEPVRGANTQPASNAVAPGDRPVGSPSAPTESSARLIDSVPASGAVSTSASALPVRDTLLGRSVDQGSVPSPDSAIALNTRTEGGPVAGQPASPGGVSVIPANALLADGPKTPAERAAMLGSIAQRLESGALTPAAAAELRAPIAVPVLREMLERAPAAKAEADKLAQTIAGAFPGSRVAVAPVKSEKRAMEKILADYAGDATQMKDLARNTIVTDPDNIPAIIQRLRAAGANVKIVKNEGEDDRTDPALTTRIDRLGYTGINATVTTASGLVAEIQVNSARMIYAKEKPEDSRAILGEKTYEKIRQESGVEGGKGHALYEQFRSLPAAGEDARKDAITAESRAYYARFQPTAAQATGTAAALAPQGAAGAQATGTEPVEGAPITPGQGGGAP
jgi:hypothetical protein